MRDVGPCARNVRSVDNFQLAEIGVAGVGNTRQMPNYQRYQYVDRHKGTPLIPNESPIGL